MLRALARTGRTASADAGATRTAGSRSALVFGGLGLLLLAAMLLACGVGAVAIAPYDILGMVLDRSGVIGIAPTWLPTDETIFFQIRLPRVVGAALIGAGLSVAGVLFQGLLRNPLADPFVIGTSSGAGLGAALAMLVSVRLQLAGFGLKSLFAFVGALAATTVVYSIARVGGRTPIVTLLLAGFAVSSILGYAMSFLLILNDQLQLQMRQLYAWLMGGVAIGDWSQLAAAGPLILAASVAAFAFARPLNALALGEEPAAHLGVDVERTKALVVVVGSLVTAVAVALGGIIGFVGLVVPHTCRLLFGPDHRRLLPAAALAGATFLVLADLLARTLLAPTELPIGILTALIGGPFFIGLLRRSKREYRF